MYGILSAVVCVNWLCFGFHEEKTWLYTYLAEASAPLRRALRVIRFGKGGSATLGGIFDDWSSLWKHGSILFGRSAYDSDWKVGQTDDRHILTIASTGGGKGRSAIIPNLLTWPGSVLVIDPKGTNAAVTAARRGMGGGRVTEFMGQEVHVFDPFGVLANQGIESASFNPLALLDPTGERIAEDIWAIADAIVVQEAGDPHWNESAFNLITGLIAHIITQEPFENRNLGRLRDLLTSSDLMPSAFNNRTKK